MDAYETPNVLADFPRAWLCELTKTLVFNLEILVDDEVAKAAKEEEQKTEDIEDDYGTIYCTGFSVEAKDEKKLRILTTFHLMEKYEESVVKIFGDFEVDSIKKAFEFTFICSHAEDECRRRNTDERERMYQPIEVLGVDRRNSLVLLEMDVEDVTICQKDHRGLKMANHPPPKCQEFLLRAWPGLCPNVILWRSVSNDAGSERNSKRIFPLRSGGNMKLTQFTMTWKNHEIAKDEGVEQYAGCPVIDGNGDFFGVFYGVDKWRGYAIALEEVNGFLLKH